MAILRGDAAEEDGHVYLKKAGTVDITAASIPT